MVVSRAFEDLVVRDAIVGNKTAAARRYGVSWWTVSNMCVRLAEEALGRVDLLDGLVAVAIDEVRRVEWNRRRRAGAAKAAKEFKGLRFLLCRNWENLTGAQKGVIRDLVRANSRTFRTWQPTRRAARRARPPAARRPAGPRRVARLRQPLETRPVREAGPHDPPLQPSIEATIEWGFTNGIAESNDTSIGRIRTNALGFYDPEAFITMIILNRAGLTPDLLWAS